MGRPSSYSEELAAEVCAAVAEHGSLMKALRENDGLPAERTIYRWLATNEAFRQAYVRAREVGDEPVVEEMRQIAFDPEMPSDQKRVRIDTLKWEIARRSPKKWGDRQVIAGDPEAPLTGMSDEQLDARIKSLLAAEQGKP